MHALRAATTERLGRWVHHLGGLLVHRADPLTHLGEPRGDLRIVQPLLDVLLDDVVLGQGIGKQQERAVRQRGRSLLCPGSDPRCTSSGLMNATAGSRDGPGIGLRADLDGNVGGKSLRREERQEALAKRLVRRPVHEGEVLGAENPLPARVHGLTVWKCRGQLRA